MCLTFQMMTLEKYLTKKFEIFFLGYPHFGPSKCGISKKNYHSSTYEPTFFIAESFSIRKMWMFAKKLELNPLRFDQDVRVLSLMKHIL